MTKVYLNKENLEGKIIHKLAKFHYDYMNNINCFKEKQKTVH